MIMENVTKQQIYHKLGFALSTFLPVTMVIVLFSFLFFFSVSESSPSFLTLLIALLSTLFLVSLTKKKGSLHENQVQDNPRQKLELQPSLVDVTHTECETAQRQEMQAEALSDSSFPLDCESSNVMDKSFELSAEKYEQQADLQLDTSLPSDSESSASSIMSVSFEIDDEDSLIEIKLPSNHFWGLNEDHDQKLVSKFLPESIFKQQGLLAEIDEINEDENLIEIDISM